LVISFYYDSRYRVGQPHLIGLEDDEPTLEMFQTGGETSRMGLPAWRHFKLAYISKLVIGTERFTPRGDFHRHSDRWQRVVCSV
jgi:hypothetical protein